MAPNESGAEKFNHRKKEVRLFGALPEKACRDRRLPSEYRVLIAIATRDHLSLLNGAKEGCWASAETLADQCGLDRSTVFRAVHRLLARRGDHTGRAGRRGQEETYLSSCLPSAGRRASRSFSVGGPSRARFESAQPGEAQQPPPDTRPHKPQASAASERAVVGARGAEA